ncbi:carboxymethylenebutenolidase [Pseudoclavibacter endophyticus]|uniref:Dienelactone hydrolase family protein n=1 Tax=Pseudoclavibacter endophyticus TaxID=1778590 RepID=A0A6H9WQJ5_9MICO|nr:dienelactone hydrolase family protein [Pseudoclavibacter endophyticus]KAB1649247.1 dienelactone hydrolase family protein [Pseudoclavibacter endophyticus]GGA64122.1 carboxymethylenebutenolidase [Pseudoclavibacter endophyticus]
MGTRTTLTASDGFTLNAYRAEPDGAPRGGVVLFGEVWGLNTWVRSVTDRWAEHGYLAISPAMFDRVEYGYESEDYSRMPLDFFASYSQETALLDMAAAVEAASEGGRVGVTGYCFGGANSWRAAAQVDGVAAASGYYGGGVPNYIGLTPRVPTEMHFGSRDQGIPMEQVEELAQAHPDVDIYTYDADHGFCNSDAPRFDRDACEAASARSLAFFRTHVG